MSVLDRFFQEATRRRLRVVLPEGDDPRILQAALKLKREQIALPIVLGSLDNLPSHVAPAGLDLDGISWVDPAASERFEEYVAAYVEKRQLAENVARRMLRKPLIFGGMMVASGHADAMVAGVSNATASVIQAGAVTIGLAEGLETVSSFFLMVLPRFQGREDYPMIFADCAVHIAPTREQLADIALASHTSAQKLLSDQPRMAMLSFSSHGSAAHERVEIVTQALEIVRQRDPHLLVDGELQLDAALVPQVAAKKIKKHSDVAGQANVLIFPDLNSGNIAYKLAQHVAGAQAIGPFLQGFARPISDLSRGASVDDIVATVAVVLALV